MFEITFFFKYVIYDGPDWVLLGNNWAILEAYRRGQSGFTQIHHNIPYLAPSSTIDISETYLLTPTCIVFLPKHYFYTNKYFSPFVSS
jgi:hypothetical protein